MVKKYTCRLDYVILRRVKRKELVRGLKMPDQSVLATRFYVYSAGPDAGDLAQNVGREVMLMGKKGEEYADIPGEDDLLITNHKMVSYYVEDVDGGEEGEKVVA